MELRILTEKDLTPEMAEEIRAVQEVAFPHEWRFVTRRWFGTPLLPDDVWFLCYAEGKIVGIVRVLHRTIITSAGEVTVGGIGNVCTLPGVHATGAAKQCMKATAEYLATSGKTDFGLLFTGEQIRKYYQRLGWKLVENKITYLTEEGEPTTANHEHAMIHPGTRPVEDWPEGDIDINGPDW